MLIPLLLALSAVCAPPAPAQARDSGPAPSPSPSVLRFAVADQPRPIPAEVTGRLYRHPRARGAEARPLLVYLHGGGCKYVSWRKPGDFEELLRSFYEAGFDLLSVDWDTGINDELFIRDLTCEDATRAHLARARVIARGIRSALKKARLPTGHIALTGHSYGAYLVNLLASESATGLQVDSLISVSGVWKPWVDGRTELETGSPVLTPVAAAPALARPLLVVHARDDQAVPFSQVGFFREWALAIPASRYQVVELPKGNHWFKDAGPMQSLARAIRSFIQARSK